MRGKTRGLLATMLGVALALVAALGVVPREALADTAYADYDVTTDENKDKSGDELTALQVKFNGYDWYVIEDNSSTLNEGTLTLLAANNVATGQAFKADMSSNKYSQSDVIGVLKAMTETGDFKDVADAIVTIGSLVTDPYSGNGVYDTAEEVKLYLLSTQEAKALPSDAVRKAGDDGWWLRSPGGSVDTAACVNLHGNVFDLGDLVNNEHGVRPALKLDLSKVAFDSNTNTFSLPTPYPLWVGGTQVTSANAEDADGTRGWSYTPAVTEGGVTTPATLTLTDYSYEGEGHVEDNASGAISGAIYAEEDLTIIANGDNTVTKTGTAGAGIYVDTNLTVGGSGTLSVTNNQTNGVAISGLNVAIGGGTVKVSGFSSGVFANNDITITGSTVDARSTSNTGKALQCFGVLRIESSTVDAAGGPNGNGVFGMAGVEIEGGSVIATGSDGVIYGTVKNAIPGVGWADAAGTEGKTRIPTSEPGQKLIYPKVQFPAYEVTYKVTNGTWSDGGTTDKTEPVAHGSKPDGVPTGMKAAEGYEGGAWDTDPAGATITEATTFTYAFTAKGAPAATHKVSVAQAEGGTVSADKSEAAEGEIVAVTATPADGWELEAVTVDGEAIGGTTFAMPARDVTVSARFAKKGEPAPAGC